jgi:hypothetical protein
MKKILLITGLFLGTLFSANAQVTVTVPSTTFAGGFFATAYNAGVLHGTLTSIDINVTLSASVDQTYASDFAILATTGLTATDQLVLQAGGYTDFGFDEHIEWGTGDSDTVGTMCTATVTLVNPINFDFNPALKLYFGNGYSSETGSGTWSGSFTLNGVSLEPLAVNQSTLESNFSVFPNPATNVVNVSNNNTKITAIAVTDLNGRVVKQLSFDSLSNVQVNIADLSAGVYMMNIKSSEGEATKKIIKN